MWTKILILGLLGIIVSGTHHWEDEKHHAPQPYRFGYEVKDKEGKQYRHEESDGHGSVKGSYGYTDEKGLYREVHYVADKNGFRAKVKTNEPGTSNQDPADVKVEASPQIHELHGARVIPEIVPVYHKPATVYHKSSVYKKPAPVYRENTQSYHKPALVKQYHKINTDINVPSISSLHGFSYKPTFESNVPSISSSLHGFSYKPAFESKSLLDGHKAGGYKIHVPHYRNFHGLKNEGYGDNVNGLNVGYGASSGSYGNNIEGLKFDSEIEKIIEELRSSGRYSNGQSGFKIDNDEIKKLLEESKYKNEGFSNNYRNNDFEFKEFRDLGLNKDRSLFDLDV